MGLGSTFPSPGCLGLEAETEPDSKPYARALCWGGGTSFCSLPWTASAFVLGLGFAAGATP